MGTRSARKKAGRKPGKKAKPFRKYHYQLRSYPPEHYEILKYISWERYEREKRVFLQDGERDGEGYHIALYRFYKTIRMRLENIKQVLGEKPKEHIDILDDYIKGLESED